MNQAVARDQWSAGGLALLVHLFFFLALVFGVSWKTLPHVPVYADLWNALPARPLPPAPAEPPPPEPVKPESVKSPPPKPLPAKPPELPKAAPPERKADIALKEKKAAEKKRLQEAEEEKKRQDALKKQKLEEERKDVERRRKLEEEMERAEQERLVQEEKQLQVRREEARKAVEVKKQAQEKARKAMEEQLAAEMADDLAAETQAIRQQVAVSARLKVVDEYKGRIQLKIKGLLINPPGLAGKPEAVYRVDLLPNGEVTRATLVKSSGQPAYDRAVESAILKASPLPLPPDRDAAAAFRDGLELKFRPD